MKRVSKTFCCTLYFFRFTNEDVDWSLRAAAIGLNLYRFENIAMLLKVVEPLNSDVSLDNT